MKSKQHEYQPLHGGDLLSASQRYGVPMDEWVDLSTGINPEPYPFNNIQDAAFCQLPYLRPAFYAAAKEYYTVDDILAVSGSQAVIQALPELLQDKLLLAPAVGYQEYVKHWLKAGRKIQQYASFELDEARAAITYSLTQQPDQHVLIINPNNPTGLLFSADDIRQWATMLDEGCYLIVDEAFADMAPSNSMFEREVPCNVMVLRSFGKFFGLAGIRLGFVATNSVMLARLNARLGLWQINGPAQELAISALHDTAWQVTARANIEENATLCHTFFLPLLQLLDVFRITHQGLFSSYLMRREEAYLVFEMFAREGVLFRVIDVDSEQALLRMGIVSKHAKHKVDSIIRAVKIGCEQVGQLKVAQR